MPPGCNVLGWTIVEGVERDEALIKIQLVKHYTDSTITLTLQLNYAEKTAAMPTD